MLDHLRVDIFPWSALAAFNFKFSKKKEIYIMLAAPLILGLFLYSSKKVNSISIVKFQTLLNLPFSSVFLNFIHLSIITDIN